MKSIVLHIEYLLRRSDCVVIPGIGALVARHLPARFSESEGMIYPPVRELSLNPSIIHDDGMLAASVARAEGLKFEEARLKMMEMIADLKSILDAEKEVPLGRIGLLCKGDDEMTRLVPYRSALADASECGFVPARLKSIPVLHCGQEPAAGSLDENPENTDLGTSSVLTGDIEMRPFSRKNYYIPVNKIFAKCAASVIVLAFVALAFILPQREPAPDKIEASMNPVESIRHASRPDLAVSSGRHASDDTASFANASVKSSVSAPNAPVPLVDCESAEGKVENYLIVATFHTYGEAERFIESRKGGAYPLQCIKGRNVWRISAGHGDRDTLRSLLNSSEFRSAFAEAWIWTAE